MEILQILAGPIVGAVIGYFTNYLAVKMLFRPYNPVMIGNFRLPFTPGIIPKRKEKLAEAVGKTVGEKLFTGDDMENALLSEPLKTTIVSNVTDSLFEVMGKYNLEELGSNAVGKTEISAIKNQVAEIITDRIIYNVEKADVGKLIAEKGGDLVADKLKGSMLSMFLSKDKINSFIAPIGEEIEAYIAENGKEMLYPKVSAEIDNLCNANLAEASISAGFDKAKLQNVLTKIYEDFLGKQVVKAASYMDIAGIVKSKIENMDMAAVEAMAMQVMKKELNAIINLGALLGLVIGCVMIFV